MHLKQSDPKPPIDPNRLTLIGFRFCPYVDRVKLVLSYYKINQSKFVTSMQVYRFLLPVVSVCVCDIKELVNQISRSTYMIISAPKINSCDVSHYRQACTQINEAIKGPYFTGSDISLADLIIFPHLHRLETIMGRIHGKKSEEIHELNTNDELCKEWPKLTAFLSIMRKQTFVADVTIPCQIHAKYAATVASGCNNPDIE
ncbi:hypothetical protein MN116_008142 [Schistosoma mekongi]|uniref:Uncharacterized protein n=1 Tax=Schistosoma mekongi TaxID=38744 RepID=A0AAE1Z6P8_SCHME|nr:hypothetical protein MN116_008142 [Schistosoma mekongi]